MTGHRPWRELVEKTFTPEERRRLDEPVERDLKVSAAYDDALERMTGKRQAPPDVEFRDLTADFTEAQWAEYKRLVKQLCAERGIEEAVDETVDSWREDQAEQERDLVEMEVHTEACERLTGRRPSPPEVELWQLTADFTEAQWGEYKRLVKQLYAERGIEAPPFERPSTWANDDRFTLSAYIEGIREGWPEPDIERLIVCGLPRDFNILGKAEQREALAERVPLTHTKWDALLAAMVEHVAWLHGHERPAWVDEPERFLDTTWVLSPIRSGRMESLMYAPAAFLRHGAIPDPRDLDSRGGERHEWVPVP